MSFVISLNYDTETEIRLNGRGIGVSIPGKIMIILSSTGAKTRFLLVAGHGCATIQKVTNICTGIRFVRCALLSDPSQQ